ncbi:thioredoxin family protein [archaeon]|jgi:thiol-disulfide isomerase/thioredoxin|nr:thioredoxin family protein [archaeon]MBT7380280.1 thioredoxin family protein [archaeon]MBT7508525.1 thioredoxin family protein [archaeon]
MILKNVLVLLGLLLLFGCNVGGAETLNSSNIEMITITSSGNFSYEECINRNLEDQYLMLESKYCGHCQKSLPLFLEVCEELNLTCNVIDISEDIEKEKLDYYKINIMYTPTFVFDCNYYVGAMEKSEFLEVLK